MAKAATVKLERIHPQPGWCLFQVDKDSERRGRLVSFPQGPKGEFKLADAECLVDLDEDAIEVDVTCATLKLGRLVLIPMGKIAAFIAPEPAEKPVLVLP